MFVRTLPRMAQTADPQQKNWESGICSLYQGSNYCSSVFLVSVHCTTCTLYQLSLLGISEAHTLIVSERKYLLFGAILSCCLYLTLIKLEDRRIQVLTEAAHRTKYFPSIFSDGSYAWVPLEFWVKINSKYTLKAQALPERTSVDRDR